MRWRSHAGSMRRRSQTAQPSASLIGILPIYSERAVVSLYSMTTSNPVLIDRLDAALIELLAAEPRIGVLEASRRLGVARGTVQARLDRMRDRGVVTGYGPDVDPAALGYEVTAFITLEIRQAGGHDPVADRLAAIPEVLEVHTITGAGDMLCRVVARTNADLQRVLDAIVSAEGVVRSSTLISLATQVPYRILPLVRAASGPQSRLLRSPLPATPSRIHHEAGRCSARWRLCADRTGVEASRTDDASGHARSDSCITLLLCCIKYPAASQGALVATPCRGRGRPDQPSLIRER
jgi:DNA-binding Lrp family transcriptional regulator